MNGAWFGLMTVARYIALSLISRYHCLDPTNRDISGLHCTACAVIMRSVYNNGCLHKVAWRSLVRSLLGTFCSINGCKTYVKARAGSQVRDWHAQTVKSWWVAAGRRLMRRLDNAYWHSFPINAHPFITQHFTAYYRTYDLHSFPLHYLH